jgi:putative membrane protein
MRLRFVIFTTLGLTLTVYLLIYVGWRAVLAAAIAVGWGGFAILCLCALALFVLLGIAWYVLLPAASPVRLWVLVRARMVRDSAAEVLPFSQLGGIALGVRAAVLYGVSPPLACASMIVDVTTEMVAQIAYVALGVAILTARAPRSSVAASLTSTALIGLTVATVAAGLFLAVQRYGQQITARLARPLLRKAGQGTAAVSAALGAIYRSPARVALSVALHFAAWVANAFAAWIGFRLIGARIEPAAVLAIESLVYGIRSAGVFIPNALGVQEVAYAVLTPLFGVSAEYGLALSVLKRARDIAVGVPVLLVWQAAEGRRALARGPLAAPPGEAPP